MIHESHTSCYPHAFYRRVGWGAILAGALVGIGISFLLNLFAVAIGLSVVKSVDGTTSLAVGGFIALLIATIVSTYAAGFTASFLGGANEKTGLLYGFISWCLALILMAFIATSLGHYVAAYTNFISNPVVVMTEGGTVATTTPATKPVAAKPVVVHASVSDLAQSAFLVFVLFLVGAFFAGFGGYSGARCVRHCLEHDEEHSVV